MTLQIKKLSLILVICYLWSCNNDREQTKDNVHQKLEQYPDGSTKSIRTLDRFDRKQGLAEDFFKGGGLKRKYHFENDTLSGEYESFFPDRLVESKAFFWMGKAVGPRFYYRIDGRIRLYNEDDFDGQTYYVQKYNDSGEISREEGVGISPHLLMPDVKNDTLIHGAWVNVYFFYAEPKGYQNTLIGYFDNTIVPVQYLNSHVGLLQDRLHQGRHTIHILSVLKNAIGVVANDSVSKVIYVR